MLGLTFLSFSDFLSIRKIPLNERPYLTEGGDLGDPEDRSDDPEVHIFLDKIRSVLLTDRAIHDQESLFHK
jgi:ATP-dependent RNA helicase DDX55/SPB4